MRWHDIAVMPELALSGYPPEDLLFHAGLRRQVTAALDEVRAATLGTAALVGYPEYTEGAIYNAAALFADGAAGRITASSYCPTTACSTKSVTSRPAALPGGRIGGIPVGLSICEDVWQPESVRQAVDAGARLLLTLNASPYHMEKGRERESIAQTRAHETGVPLVYVNLVGGQDELVFDGASFVTDAHGTVTQRCPAFEEGLYQVELV